MGIFSGVIAGLSSGTAGFGKGLQTIGEDELRKLREKNLIELESSMKEKLNRQTHGFSMDELEQRYQNTRNAQDQAHGFRREEIADTREANKDLESERYKHNRLVKEMGVKSAEEIARLSRDIEREKLDIQRLEALSNSGVAGSKVLDEEAKRLAREVKEKIETGKTLWNDKYKNVMSVGNKEGAVYDNKLGVKVPRVNLNKFLQYYTGFKDFDAMTNPDKAKRFMSAKLAKYEAGKKLISGDLTPTEENKVKEQYTKADQVLNQYMLPWE